ncbi:MAG: Mur ligase family protein [Turneriella sp.]
MKLPEPAPIENDILNFFADRNFERSRRFAPGAYDPGILRRFLSAMDNPQFSYRTLHIAGTVGKGSVTTFLARALAALGLRTGAYLSPHFVSLRERITINGGPISADDLTNEWRALARQQNIGQLSFFDAMTALAFAHFHRRGCHWAVIETGLGGRFDSTNNLLAQAAIITRIGYDHRQLLGDTLTAIAGEKAGIIRQGQNVYTFPQADEVMQVLIGTCNREGARLIVIAPQGEDFIQQNLDFALQVIHNELGLTAATAASIAHEVDRPIFGRFAELQHSPRIVFDGAHNAPAMYALAAIVNRQPESDCNIFLNTMQERDIAEFCGILTQQIIKNVRLFLFPMPQPQYYAAAMVSPALATPDMGEIHTMLRDSKQLHIFTGSMGIFAELHKQITYV